MIKGVGMVDGSGIDQCSKSAGDLVYDSNHIAPVVNKDGGYERAKAVTLLSTGTDGIISVHLSENPAGVFTLFDVVAGAMYPLGIDFNQISANGYNGATLTLDSKFTILL